MHKLKNIGFVNILLTIVLITFVIPPQILNPIFLGLLFVVVLARQIIFKKSFHKHNFNKVSLCFILYFLMLLISLTYSEDLSRGIKVVTASISFLLIPLIPLFISKTDINLKWIANNYVNFLCLIFFLLFFIAIYKNISENYTLEYIIDRLNGSKVKDGRYDYFNYWYFAYDKFTYPLRIQPIYLGLFTNVGLVLLLYIKNCIKLKSYYFRLAILSVLILLVASRSQIFIFVLNYSLFLLIFDKSNLQKKVLTICSLVAVFAIISLINPVTRTRLIEAVTYKEAFYKDDFGGASIRIKKWDSALRSIKNSPVFGYGVGDGKNELLEQYKRDKFYLGFYNKYNAHNQYLDTVLCLGFIGLIILLLIIFYAYKYAVNSMSLFLITNIFTVGFLTESMLYRQWGIMAFSFLLVMFSVFKLEKHED